MFKWRKVTLVICFYCPDLFLTGHHLARLQFSPVACLCVHLLWRWPLSYSWMLSAARLSWSSRRLHAGLLAPCLKIRVEHVEGDVFVWAASTQHCSSVLSCFCPLSLCGFTVELFGSGICGARALTEAMNVNHRCGSSHRVSSLILANLVFISDIKHWLLFFSQPRLKGLPCWCQRELWHIDEIVFLFLNK